ncbi:MAG: thioredoxin domain-containing protein [Rhodocyclaceae bacterium]|nr:thioredoxin domain-containing protein [Rhodocyclaceae bacterium]
MSEDARKVVEFFAYTCPYCQRFHYPIATWAKTLPSSLSFESVAIPLLGSSMELDALVVRASIAVMAPQRVALYDQALLDGVSTSGGQLGAELILRAVRDAGLDPARLALAPEARTQAAGKLWLERARRYGVRATPTVAIGGRFVVTPDATAARPEMFAALLNGLVSRILS